MMNEAPPLSEHFGLQTDEDIITDCKHCTNHARLSIIVIETLADMLGVNPIDTQFDLHKHFDLDALDSIGMDNDQCAGVGFYYGDYKILACSCGSVYIVGSIEDHVNGEMEIPVDLDH